MPTIYPLPANLVSKIAAGEVIERPAFVIKELIDNSLDAGATQILIEVEDSGLRLIQVSDNGKGMDPDDLKMSFQLHTTSKIRDIDDLIGISSLGFRGEALASIGAVSQLTIRSRTKYSQTGRSIQVGQSGLEKESPVGMPVGTIVTVKNLFNQVPARKKFLNNLVGELRLISEIVLSFSLAFPEVSFKLTHNHKTILEFNQYFNLEQRMKELIGPKFLTDFLHINYQTDHLKIWGYISKPSYLTTDSSKQFLFVNQRRVKDKLISQTIKEGYLGLISKTEFPLAILFIEMPYQLVDINVHPRKDQVRFVNPETVLSGLKQMIGQSLSGSDLTPQLRLTSLTNTFAGDLLRHQTQLYQPIKKLDLSKIHQVCQLNNLYVIVFSGEGIDFIDQHAAHERILYEEFTKEFKKQKLKQPKVDVNKIIELSFSDADLLLESLDHFQKLGFEIEPFGKNAFKIISVPKVFQDYKLDVLIEEALADLKSTQKIKDVDLQSQKMIAFLACRAAIMSGQKLTQKQMLDLLKKLDKTANNATCPHGRPTKIELSMSELNKLFRRA